MRLDERLRWLCSFAPSLGLVSAPDDRPQGISAVVRVKGEEEWLEPCLLSIRDFADEVVLLDNGAAPATRRTVERARGVLGARLRVEECPELDLFEMSNLGLARARFRWTIRWDADFVAHTDGPLDIARLRRHLLGLDRRRYYLVYVPAAEVAGDLRHQFPDRRLRFDGQIHVAGAAARYVRVEREVRPEGLSFPDRILRARPVLRLALESLRVPKFYRVLRWPSVAYVHVHVKSAVPAMMRHFWLEWLGDGDVHRYPTLKAYAEEQIRVRWGISDVESAAAHYMRQYCRGLVPVDHALSGPYPALLRSHVEAARYEIEYADGVAVDRREGARTC